MKAAIGHPTSVDIARFTQLINKSNQFNLRTRRYSDAGITQMLADSEKYSLISISLEDKFGKYGIISCIILERFDDTTFIDTWVMSCRVLKRGVEQAAFNSICDYAREWGCAEVAGEYIPTKKNHMVADLLPDLGYERSLDNGVVPAADSGCMYRMKLDITNRKEHHISVEKI